MNLNTNNYPNLLGGTVRTTAPQAPSAPMGGANWDAGLGLTNGYAPDRVTIPLATPDAATMRQNMLTIFQAGVSRDLAGRNQLQTLSKGLAGLNEGQLRSLHGLLAQAGTQAEQIFILKAYSAGESWNNLVQFASEMRGLPEGEIIRRATMRDDADVIQQWQDSCGPTLMQTIAGEADPRFAWELNKSGDLARIDPNGANQVVAGQQKQWLETYGGRAVERGQAGGQGIALNQMLNDMMAPLVGVSYNTLEVNQPGPAVAQIAQLLDQGYDVPLRLSWNAPDSGADNGHFVLAMAARGPAGYRELQIHDPWTGQTRWVAEADIQRNSFAPIFNGYARLSHFYAAQPISG